jgi:hypothetical protein
MQKLQETLGSVVLASALVCGLVAGACGHDHHHDHVDLCREHPEDCPDGAPGSFCDHDSDCDGICCTEDKNCGGGMCTYPCDNDHECPDYMLCEHHVCFYRCSHDSDCAEGQSCEHGNTICEWP